MTNQPVNGAEDDDGDFAAFLASVRPKTNREMTEELKRLTRAVRDTGKPGVLVLTVQLKPLKDDEHVLQVFDSIKVKLPEHDRKGSLAYPDADGNLSRSDPNSLPLWRDEDIKTAPSAQAPTDIKEPPK